MSCLTLPTGLAAIAPSGFAVRAPVSRASADACSCCAPGPGGPCPPEPCSCVYEVETCSDLPIACYSGVPGTVGYICKDAYDAAFGPDYNPLRTFQLGIGGLCARRTGERFDLRANVEALGAVVLDVPLIPRGSCLDPECPDLTNIGQLFVLGRNPCDADPSHWQGPRPVVPLADWLPFEQGGQGRPSCFYGFANDPVTGRPNCWLFSCAPPYVPLAELDPGTVGASGAFPSCCGCLCGGDTPEHLIDDPCLGGFPGTTRQEECCCPPANSAAMLGARWGFVLTEVQRSCNQGQVIRQEVECNCGGVGQSIDNADCCRTRVFSETSGFLFEFTGLPPVLGASCPAQVYRPELLCEPWITSRDVRHSCFSSATIASGVANVGNPCTPLNPFLGPLSYEVRAGYAVRTGAGAPCSTAAPCGSAAGSGMVMERNGKGIFVPRRKELIVVPGGGKASRHRGIEASSGALSGVGCGGCVGVQGERF